MKINNYGALSFPVLLGGDSNGSWRAALYPPLLIVHFPLRINSSFWGSSHTVTACRSGARRLCLGCVWGRWRWSWRARRLAKNERMQQPCLDPSQPPSAASTPAMGEEAGCCEREGNGEFVTEGEHGRGAKLWHAWEGDCGRG